MRKAKSILVALAIVGAVGCHPVPHSLPDLRAGAAIQGFQQGPCAGFGEMMATGLGESARSTANVTRSVMWRGQRRYCFTTWQSSFTEASMVDASMKR